MSLFTSRGNKGGKGAQRHTFLSSAFHAEARVQVHAIPCRISVEKLAMTIDSSESSSFHVYSFIRHRRNIITMSEKNDFKTRNFDLSKHREPFTS